MKPSLVGRIAKGLAYLVLLMAIVTAVDMWRSQDLPAEVTRLAP